MKMIGNLERPISSQFRQTIESIGKRKMHILLTALFLLVSFFLSQAVLFDTAVPFFLPVWALAQTRFRKYLLWVFIGGMTGSAFLGLGQAVIHLFELWVRLESSERIHEGIVPQPPRSRQHRPSRGSAWRQRLGPSLDGHVRMGRGKDDEGRDGGTLGLDQPAYFHLCP